MAVDALVLEHGFIDFRQSAGETERTVRLEELEGKGSLRLGDGGQRLKAELALGSKLAEPMEGPFELRLSASGQGDHRTADVELTIAGSRLSATAALDGSTRAHVRIDGLAVDPPPAPSCQAIR